MTLCRNAGTKTLYKPAAGLCKVFFECHCHAPGGSCDFGSTFRHDPAPYPGNWLDDQRTTKIWFVVRALTEGHIPGGVFHDEKRIENRVVFPDCFPAYRSVFFRLGSRK